MTQFGRRSVLNQLFLCTSAVVLIFGNVRSSEVTKWHFGDHSAPPRAPFVSSWLLSAKAQQTAEDPILDTDAAQDGMHVTLDSSLVSRDEGVHVGQRPEGNDEPFVEQLQEAELGASHSSQEGGEGERRRTRRDEARYDLLTETQKRAPVAPPAGADSFFASAFTLPSFLSSGIFGLPQSEETSGSDGDLATTSQQYLPNTAQSSGELPLPGFQSMFDFLFSPLPFLGASRSSAVTPDDSLRSGGSSSGGGISAEELTSLFFGGIQSLGPSVDFEKKHEDGICLVTVNLADLPDDSNVQVSMDIDGLITVDYFSQKMSADAPEVSVGGARHTLNGDAASLPFSVERNAAETSDLSRSSHPGNQRHRRLRTPISPLPVFVSADANHRQLQAPSIAPLLHTSAKPSAATPSHLRADVSAFDDSLSSLHLSVFPFDSFPVTPKLHPQGELRFSENPNGGLHKNLEEAKGNVDQKGTLSTPQAGLQRQPTLTGGLFGVQEVQTSSSFFLDPDCDGSNPTLPKAAWQKEDKVLQIKFPLLESGSGEEEALEAASETSAAELKAEETAELKAEETAELKAEETAELKAEETAELKADVMTKRERKSQRSDESEPWLQHLRGSRPTSSLEQRIGDQPVIVAGNDVVLRQADELRRNAFLQPGGKPISLPAAAHSTAAPKQKYIIPLVKMEEF